MEEAQAGTGCGACTYPTCREYAVAVVSGKVVVTKEAENATYEAP